MHTRTSSLTRPAHLAVTLLALMLSLSGSAANAQQDYPNKPERLVIPYPAGGTTVLLGRMTGQRLAAQWKQPVIADNRPGAGGSLGAAAVARAPADGYLLVLGNSASHGAWELLYPGNPPYNAIRDFTPLSLLATTRLVLVVRAGLPVKTAAELVTMARAKPGALSYASPSVGSSPHLGMELFKMVAGIDIVHVPYAGAAPARTALLAGTVDAYMGGVQAMQELARADKVRVLGVVSATRATDAPTLPTLTEQGYAQAEIDTWYGLLAPAGLAPELITQLNAATRRALDGEDVRAELARLDFERAISSPQEFAALLAREREKLARIIKTAGIKGG